MSIETSFHLQEQASDEPARILIVDDVPENIGVLFEFLITQGYEVSIAPDGIHALEVIRYDPPDLILLDVMMPGIDGFETCRRIKADPTYAWLPVIFMTALSDTIDKAQGLWVGAVDYITKPVQKDEVLARVHAHLASYRLQQQLLAQRHTLSQELNTLLQPLQQQLAQLQPGERLTTEQLQALQQQAAALGEQLARPLPLPLPDTKSTQRDG